MATPYTTFNDALTLIKEALTQELHLPPERVFRVARPLKAATNIKSDTFVTIQGLGGIVDPLWADSVGRVATAVDRDLHVTPYLRLALDDVTAQDRIAVALHTLEDRIVNILQIWEPTGLLEPVHYRGISEQTEESAVPGWARSDLRFSVKFLQEMDQDFE